MVGRVFCDEIIDANGCVLLTFPEGYCVRDHPGPRPSGVLTRPVLPRPLIRRRRCVLVRPVSPVTGVGPLVCKITSNSQRVYLLHVFPLYPETQLLFM